MQSKQETSFLIDLSEAELTAINGGFSSSSSSRVSVSITAEEAANAPGGAIFKSASSENGLTTTKTLFGAEAIAAFNAQPRTPRIPRSSRISWNSSDFDLNFG
jgi:hypothetical protein